VSDIRRLLIANRGEIAARIARTARAMGIATIAVYSDPDRDALHVRSCDEAIAIGGAAPRDSYLRVELLLEAAALSGADAVHPGYGFLAEDANFARAVVDAGLTWVGPPADVIAAMGDKLAAKRLVADAGVPIPPSAELDGDPLAAGRTVGYPLLVKAAAGGGGKGMRLVATEDELAAAIDAARREAAAAFGDDRVFFEHFVTQPRHVEVQILGDSHGSLVHLGERECSIQRRHQKVLEESPSSAVDADLRERLTGAALAAGRAIGYVNAGTVEFVLGADGEFAFLEVNTRLQVEHAVTELVTGLDLVRLQLLVARGEPLPFGQEDVRFDGHAIEVRLYAEDPARGHLPSPGRVHCFEPGGADIRWDAGLGRTDEITPHYDPMIAKAIAHRPTRGEAAVALAAALDATVFHGPATNRALLAAVLRDAAFLAGETTTDFLERHFSDEVVATLGPDDGAVDAAAVVATVHASSERLASRALLPDVPAGWRSNPGDAQRTSWRFEDEVIDVDRPPPPRDVHAFSPVSRAERAHIVVRGRTVAVEVFAATEDAVDVALDGRRRTYRVSRAGAEAHIATPGAAVTLTEVDRFPAPEGEQAQGATRAPMPGSVVTVDVEVGASVSRGDLLAIVEAMKMEHRITAPYDGVVADVRVVAGEQVDTDDVLVVIEPSS